MHHQVPFASARHQHTSRCADSPNTRSSPSDTSVPTVLTASHRYRPSSDFTSGRKCNVPRPSTFSSTRRLDGVNNSSPCQQAKQQRMTVRNPATKRNISRQCLHLSIAQRTLTRMQPGNRGSVITVPTKTRSFSHLKEVFIFGIQKGLPLRDNFAVQQNAVYNMPRSIDHDILPRILIKTVHVLSLQKA
jgi:hypothetical protein